MSLYSCAAIRFLAENEDPEQHLGLALIMMEIVTRFTVFIVNLTAQVLRSGVLPNEYTELSRAYQSIGQLEVPLALEASSAYSCAPTFPHDQISHHELQIIANSIHTCGCGAGSHSLDLRMLGLE
jgi:hypothetical protein